MSLNQTDFLFVIYNKTTREYEIGRIITDKKGNTFYVTSTMGLAINEGIVVSVFKDEIGVGI